MRPRGSIGRGLLWLLTLSAVAPLGCQSVGQSPRVARSNPADSSATTYGRGSLSLDIPPSQGGIEGGASGRASLNATSPPPPSSLLPVPEGARSATGPGHDAESGTEASIPNSSSGSAGASQSAEETRASDEALGNRPYLLAGLVNVFSDDLSDNTGAPGPDRRGERITQKYLTGGGKSRADIKDPDPDLAGFPNSAFTLPEGRLYIETDPLAYHAPNRRYGLKYNADFLIRYGLTDSVEFRIFGDGYTYVQKGPRPAAQGHAQRPSGSTSGFSPLAFDFKVHLWDENKKYWVPATALEVYLQTTLGSPAFDSGTQPSVNLNIDKALPLEIALEASVGITGNRTSRNQTYYQSSFQWSLQHKVIGNFEAYLQGYVNNAALPRFQETTGPGQRLSDTVIGLGGIYTVTKRLAVFGSYNFGLTAASPAHLILLGTAVAF